jgi:hypothetical protein
MVRPVSAASPTCGRTSSETRLLGAAEGGVIAADHRRAYAVEDRIARFRRFRQFAAANRAEHRGDARREFGGDSGIVENFVDFVGAVAVRGERSRADRRRFVARYVGEKNRLHG